MIIVQIVNVVMLSGILMWLGLKLEIDTYKKLLLVLLFIVTANLIHFIVKDIMQMLGVL